MNKPKLWLILLPALLAAPILSGCALMEFLAVAFAPPAQQDALYQLPKDQRILVFADDTGPALDYPPLKRVLTEKLNAQLAEHKLAAEVIPYDRLTALQARSPNFGQMHIPTVGSLAGADLVVYANIDSFQLRERREAPFWQGKLTVLVKVVDTHKGRLWPIEAEEGFELTVTTPPVEYTDEAYGVQLADELAARMADRIAKLFYKHPAEPEEASKDVTANQEPGTGE